MYTIAVVIVVFVHSIVEWIDVGCGRVTCEELFPRIWSGTIDKIATAIDDCALMRFDSTASASAITKSNKAIAQCGMSNQRTKTSTGQLREKFKVLKEWID